LALIDDSLKELELTKDAVKGSSNPHDLKILQYADNMIKSLTARKNKILAGGQVGAPGLVGVRLAGALDSIADRLEERGLTRQAEAFDAISNSIEAAAFGGIMNRIKQIMARLGIRRIPTPMEAARALSRATPAVLHKLYEAVAGGTFPGGPHALPGGVPAMAYGESSAAGAAPATMVADPEESEWGVAEGGIPSEFERLSHGESELLPHFLSVLKTVAEQRNAFPSEQEIRQEIEDMITGVQLGTSGIVERSAALVSRIDSIADLLEGKGFLREASDLDVISNTLEALDTSEMARKFKETAVRDMQKDIYSLKGHLKELQKTSPMETLELVDLKAAIHNLESEMVDLEQQGWGRRYAAEPTKVGTVGINEFVKRQTKPDFAGTKVDAAKLEQLRREAERQAASNALKPGYAPYVNIARVRDPSIMCPIARVTPQNKDLLKTRMTKRREGEEEFEQRYFEAKDVKPIPSDHVDVILYSREKLEKEPDGKPTGAEWDIVSVNAEPTPGGTPMVPETIKRNIKGMAAGGSGHQHTQEELSQSEAFWDGHAMIM